MRIDETLLNYLVLSQEWFLAWSCENCPINRQLKLKERLNVKRGLKTSKHTGQKFLSCFLLYKAKNILTSFTAITCWLLLAIKNALSLPGLGIRLYYTPFNRRSRRSLLSRMIGTMRCKKLKVFSSIVLRCNYTTLYSCWITVHIIKGIPCDDVSLSRPQVRDARIQVLYPLKHAEKDLMTECD